MRRHDIETENVVKSRALGCRERQAPSVGAERRIDVGLGEDGDGENQRIGGDIPDLERIVAGAGDQQRAIRVECDMPNILSVRLSQVGVEKETLLGT